MESESSSTAQGSNQAAERLRRVLELARGPEPEDEPVDVLDQFDEQVRRRAGHTAVRAADAAWTYAELDARAGRVASFLRSLGVRPECKVGISLSRGAFELVSMLGTLRAGGAYVPLDPSHPLERLRMVIDDARPAVLILADDSPLVGHASAGVRVISRRELQAVASRSDGMTWAWEPATPGQLQYVLYTSGSTGKPKGVEIERGAFANFITSMKREPGFTKDDCLLAVTTTTFDIAGLELFLPLCSGGTVEIVPREVAMDPKQLRQRLDDERITCMQATPATWRLLIEAGWTGNPRLRLLCGGEAMSPELAAKLLDRCGELWNMYGPTETTVWSTLERIRPTPGDPTEGEASRLPKISIGRPIDRTQVYVLSQDRQPLPPGEVGEIFIGGAGLARGYHGRPELTAEKFIQTAWSGGRVYATGDLGRMFPDGRLECLGRIDHQVKIHGYRIELGEIESVLRAVPAVTEVLVVAHRIGDGDPALVAYWTGAAERDELRSAARARLPSYMVPTAFVSLPAFPLNTNGKIDRKALPPPTEVEPSSIPVLPPRNAIEERIASVFARVLGLPAVGVDQSFFDLGGTSILAAEAIAKLDEDLGTNLPLRLLFEHPTVEGLAGRLDNPGSQDEPIAIVLQKGRAGEPPLMCLFGVRLYSDLALAMTDGTPVIGMHVPVRYLPGVEQRPPLEAIVERYVALVRQHQAQGPYRLAGLCYGGVVAFEVARRLRAEGEDVALVVVFDAVLPGGIRLDPRGLARTMVRRVLEDPVGLTRRVVQRARALAEPRLGRLPIVRSLWGLEPQPRPAGDSPVPVDFPVDGPEADADIAAFAATGHHLDAKLMVFRALRDPVAMGRRVDLEMGWRGFAREIVAEGIEDDHLGILRPPHVHEVARRIMRELAASQTGRPDR